MIPATSPGRGTSQKKRERRPAAVVRFAGDSGDGMQVIGAQFTTATALAGNDLSTFPDFPAEIRAPAGSLAGVSGFQINFANQQIYTPGDRVQTLVAMNPASLKVNLADLETGGLAIVNTDGFTPTTLKQAGYESNPLEDGSLSGKYELIAVQMTDLTEKAVAELGLSHKDADRCKNFFALGLVCWLYDRPLEPVLHWLVEKFAKQAKLLEGNELALKAGYFYGETAELTPVQFQIDPAHLPPGKYRKIKGNDATAMGLVTAAQQAGKKLFYASYPITPASEILHDLVKRKNFGVRVFQAEDEIAAMCAAIGAAYGGEFAATGTSGPGLSLKGEAMGLAVMLELPMVIVNVQRGGPSTGLPTKTEQADLLQAFAGRHGECPMPILAAQSPGDCFWTVLEAFQIAVRYMTPVMVLSDGYIANSTEPWRIPNVADLPRIEVQHETNPEGFQPYSRNERLARPWAIPGTPGLAHRIGGLEKADLTGAVSYDGANHEKMVKLRAAKVAGVVRDVPPLKVNGPEDGDLLVVSWGGTYGAVRTAVERAQANGGNVAHAHLRHMNPFPPNLGEILKRYRRVLVPELNLGQLQLLLRAAYLVDTVGLNKVQGRPFAIFEVYNRIQQILDELDVEPESADMPVASNEPRASARAESPR